MRHLLVCVMALGVGCAASTSLRMGLGAGADEPAAAEQANAPAEIRSENRNADRAFAESAHSEATPQETRHEPEAAPQAPLQRMGETSPEEAERQRVASAEWETRQEAERVEQERAVAAHEAEALAEASRHGFDEVICSKGVVFVLGDVVANATPMEDLKRLAIELVAFDEDMVALQVLDARRAMFVDDDSGIRVIFKSRAQVYEGTPITSLGFDFVKITGIETYRTVTGGTKQAFIVEPAW
jgi:hypothetical protein